MKKMAPVVLFVYNKPGTTLQTLKNLENNIGASDTDIHIFSDGPKQNQNDDTNLRSVEGVREIIKRKYGFKSITVHESETNKGLARSVIGGLTTTLGWSETAIMVEDDVITSRYFLQHINRNLEHYQNEERVFSIGSFNYYNSNSANFFLRVPDTYGWGVYRRAWKNFEPDSSALIEKIERSNLVDKFNFGGAYDFFKMLKDQNQGLVDSWAIRWYATCLLNNGLCLYPNVSLSKHIGNVEGAAHLSGEDVYRQDFEVINNKPDTDFIPVSESAKAVKAYQRFYLGPDESPSLLSRIRSLFR